MVIGAKTMFVMHGCVHIIICCTRLYIIIYECVCHKIAIHRASVCVCGGGGGCAFVRACVCCRLVYSVSLWVLCM